MQCSSRLAKRWFWQWISGLKYTLIISLQPDFRRLIFQDSFEKLQLFRISHICRALVCTLNVWRYTRSGLEDYTGREFCSVLKIVQNYQEETKPWKCFLLIPITNKSMLSAWPRSWQPCAPTSPGCHLPKSPGVAVDLLYRQGYPLKQLHTQKAMESNDFLFPPWFWHITDLN